MFSGYHHSGMEWEWEIKKIEWKKKNHVHPPHVAHTLSLSLREGQGVIEYLSGFKPNPGCVRGAVRPEPPLLVSLLLLLFSRPFSLISFFFPLPSTHRGVLEKKIIIFFFISVPTPPRRIYRKNACRFFTYETYAYTYFNNDFGVFPWR